MKSVANLTVSFVEQKELVLYPNKNGCVRDLLEEARKQVTTSPDEGSGRLRFVLLFVLFHLFVLLIILMLLFQSQPTYLLFLCYYS